MTDRRPAVEQLLAQANPAALFMDGLDEAIIGVGFRDELPVVLYERALIIEILVTRDEMSEPDAWEHYGYNIESAYVGTSTPVIVGTDREW